MSQSVRGTGRHNLRPLVLSMVLVALIGGSLALYHFLPIAAVPAAVASGVVLIVALKHLGLLALLLTPLYTLMRRRGR